ncbi:hypothetical protein C8R43DRAFT_1136449 [Mycena crocata]|nr:hypothetical protein C8R43DRAFT_1136449 [Mycena crocata]
MHILLPPRASTPALPIPAIPPFDAAVHAAHTDDTIPALLTDSAFRAALVANPALGIPLVDYLPRFHALSHPQNPSNFNFGQTDGQGVERACNPCAAHTHEMAAGQRHDTLHDAIDWAWQSRRHPISHKRRRDDAESISPPQQPKKSRTVPKSRAILSFPSCAT